MTYVLSEILKGQFHSHPFTTEEDKGTPIYKVTVYSDGRMVNYGKLLKDIPDILPDVYEAVEDEKDADVANNNRGDLVWYIDGADDITIKENLPKVSSYTVERAASAAPASAAPASRASSSPLASGASPSGLWISKPSHPHIGSGKYIMIGSKDAVEHRPPVIIAKKPVPWVVQPLITDLILWRSKFKFDLRMYSVIFNLEDKFYAACSKMAIGRVCVRKHDPAKDPLSAITNISVQETIPGYSFKKHMPLIYDDVGVCKTLTQDFLNRTKLRRDPEKEFHVLILGLDVMLGSDGRPILIEVNKDPALEWTLKNSERIVSEEIIVNIFGYLIPALTRFQNIDEIDGWDMISQD